MRFLYVVPNFQVPTDLGSAGKRRALLGGPRAATCPDRRGRPAAELFFEDRRLNRTCADQGGRHRAARHLSEQLLEDARPGLPRRLIDAAAPIACKLEMAKQSEDLLTGSLDQRVVYEACRRGILQRQLPLLRRHYQQKRDVMVEALRAAFGNDPAWPPPRGFFLWATLPPGVDAERLVLRADRSRRDPRRRRSVLRQRRRPESGGLSFSSPPPERIRERVTRVAAAVREEQAAGVAGQAAGSPPPRGQHRRGLHGIGGRPTAPAASPSTCSRARR